MKINKLVLAVLVATMLTTFGCATRQNVVLKGNEQEIYKSNHAGIFQGPDNAVSTAKAYAIIQKADAEATLLASYSQNSASTTQEDTKVLGFIINDRDAKWNLAIKTKFGGITIFQTDIPPRQKLEYKLRFGEYVTVWADGYNKYTNTLKVMPYADVRTTIANREVRGYWMTHLPQ